MSTRVSRMTAVDTMLEAFEWLQRNPVLIVAFFLVGIVEALGEEITVFSLLGLLLVVFVDGIAHRFADAEAAGKRTTVGEEAGVVLERYLSLLGAVLIYIVAVFVGLLLLILPGIYVGLRLALAFPAIVIDDQGAFEGLNTSWEVARGNLLKLLGISLLAILVLLSTVIVAAVVTVAIDSVALLVLLSAVVTAILSPIVQLAYARVYLENRGGGRQDGTGEDDDDRTDSSAGPADAWNEDDDWGRDSGWDDDGRDRDSSWDDDPWDGESDWDDERDRSS